MDVYFSNFSWGLNTLSKQKIFPVIFFFLNWQSCSHRQIICIFKGQLYLWQNCALIFLPSSCPLKCNWYTSPTYILPVNLPSCLSKSSELGPGMHSNSLFNPIERESPYSNLYHIPVIEYRVYCTCVVSALKYIPMLLEKRVYDLQEEPGLGYSIIYSNQP